MRRDLTARELAVDLLGRSDCKVQVAAVLSDRAGRIFSWGWNGAGNGSGLHAEAHAVTRANPRRLAGSTVTVAGRRRKNGHSVFALPCSKHGCMQLLIARGVKHIEFRDKDGLWQRFSTN